MKKFLFILILCLIFTPKPLHAETNKCPILIIDDSTDTVGQRLVYKFKEAIRRSSTMTITLDKKSAALEIQFSTLDRLPDTPGLSTIYSVTWILILGDKTRTFYDSTLGYCGASRLDEDAENFVAKTDAIVDEIATAVLELKNGGID